MTPAKIRELIEGELKEVNLLHHKLVNKYSNTDNKDAMRLLGYMCLATSCMAAAYPDLSRMDAFQELQSKFGEAMFGFDDYDKLAISTVTCEMVDEHRRAEGKPPMN